MSNNNRITIVGAGLTGVLLSIYLAKRGYDVAIYEQRKSDQLLSDKYYEMGRSLSLDMSKRGIIALKEVGLYDDIASQLVPMRKRVIHLPDSVLSIPYSTSEDHFISTVSRFSLHNALIKRASSFASIQIKFDHQFIDYDPDSKVARFVEGSTDNPQSVQTDILLGCDGAHSKMRSFLETITKEKFTKILLPYQYKVLNIPLTHAKDLTFEAMHMWPGEQSMLVSQPNLDGSFVSALILPDSGDVSFKVLEQKSDQEILGFFEKNFKDAISIAPDLIDEIKHNPLGSFMAIKGGQWQINQAVLLLGDAVHAMPPFLGQGVNSCFEDCYILNKYLDLFNDNWDFVIPHFERNRKQDVESITRMSLENYPELTNADWPHFILEREVEHFVMEQFQPFYTSFHNLICFQNVPYRYADNIRALQRNFIGMLTEKIKNNQAHLSKESVTSDFMAYLEKKKNVDDMMGIYA